LKAEKKKGISRIPTEEPKYVTENGPSKSPEKRRSNTLYSRDKSMIL